MRLVRSKTSALYVCGDGAGRNDDSASGYFFLVFHTFVYVFIKIVISLWIEYGNNLEINIFNERRGRVCGRIREKLAERMADLDFVYTESAPIYNYGWKTNKLTCS